MESWYTDSQDLWQNKIIPAFNAKYPNIIIDLEPTQDTQYNAALNSKLAGGAAGDLITCRSFDASQALYTKGYLASLNDLPGMENFPATAKLAWSTDDGSTVFCVPMDSVMQGFIYNADIFSQLGLSVPKTEADFFATLDAIKKDGRYTGLAMGTKDLWEAATMGFENIGPNYWQGEDGRKAIIAGTQKFTDPQYVAVWTSLAKWGQYLEPGYQALGESDGPQVFAQGKVAIYPAGSWELSYMNANAKFKLGIFPPPLPAGSTQCYISDHPDMGMGMNAATKHPAEARIFLQWLTTSEFSTLYANNFVGFFPLTSQPVTITDPLANEFLSWRQNCKSTIRISYQILSRNAQPNLENDLWNVSAQVINQTMTPQAAAKLVQDDLASWYKPPTP
jgi:raffinose/stachyose/melibiose transport system substrate-binding protein